MANSSWSIASTSIPELKVQLFCCVLGGCGGDGDAVIKIIDSVRMSNITTPRLALGNYCNYSIYTLREEN